MFNFSSTNSLYVLKSLYFTIFKNANIKGTLRFPKLHFCSNFHYLLILITDSYADYYLDNNNSLIIDRVLSV